MTASDLTRRQAMERGGAVIASAAPVALAGMAHAQPGKPVPAARLAATTRGRPQASAPAASSSTQAWNFVSEPDLHPPIVRLTSHGPQQAHGELLFTAPHGAPLSQGTGRQPGALIMDRNGQVVWYYTPPGMVASTLSAQVYRGRPVVTWFQGKPKASGNTIYLAGTYIVSDTSYREIASVAAVGHGWTADEHEFVITPQGTALLVALRLTTADLTSIGGPARATVVDNAVQEIDIATGRLLFQWDGLKNIPVWETHVPYSKHAGTDLYHINSIAVAPDGDLIISARHTWTVYKVSRKTGATVWRLGGKRNEFKLGTGVKFAWQHDVKMLGNRGLTMFDNEAYQNFFRGLTHVRPESRAIFLGVDERTKSVTLLRKYTHPHNLLVGGQGSVQALRDGRVFVGWGAQPYLTEYAGDGEVLLDGEFPDYGGSLHEVVQSYRALSLPWTGHPAGAPAAAARAAKSGGTRVYASWNGATEIATWDILAGPSATELSAAGTGSSTGFETCVRVPSAGPYFAAVALSATGRELGRSNPVKLA